MPVLKRAHAVMFLEATREVSLASEAGLVGDHADWQVGASWIRKALARNLQPSPPDPVGDVLATFLEQLLEPAQRHAHGGGELRWIEGLVVEVRLDMGFGTLDDERAVTGSGTSRAMRSARLATTRSIPTPAMRSATSGRIRSA